MHLEYISPSEKLSPYIRSYYFARITSNKKETKAKLFPSATHHIAFYTKGNVVLYIDGEPFHCGDATICGQVLKYFEYTAPQGAEFAGIAFHPTGLYKLLGINTHSLVNRHASLSDYIFDENYFKKVKEAHSNKEIADAHDEFLLRRLDSLNELPPLVDESLAKIIASDGMVSVIELAESCRCSRRYLEKHFLYSVGTSPGKYAKLLRFLKVIKRIEAGDEDPVHVISDFSYYDVSHFFKDFEFFMGEKPREYFQKNHPLLKVMMQKGQF